MPAALLAALLASRSAAAARGLLGGGAARATQLHCSAVARPRGARALASAAAARMSDGAPAPPANACSFAGLPVPAAVLGALASRGISSPTPIQLAATAPLARGASALLHAPTGSGKTLAFLLPLVARLHGGCEGEGEGDEAADPGRVIVLVPGQELAVQIAAEARLLFAAYRDAADAAASGAARAGGGGERVAPLRVGLLLKPHEALSAAEAGEVATASLLVCTPNPLLSAVRSARLAPVLSLCGCVVLDEADALLQPLSKYATRADKLKRAAHPRPAALALAEFVAQHLGPLPPPSPPAAPGARRPTAAEVAGWACGAFQTVALSATVGRPLREELTRLLRAPSVHALQLLATPDPSAALDGAVGADGASPAPALSSQRRVGIPPTVSHAYCAAAYADVPDRLGAAAALLASRPAVLTLIFLLPGTSVPRAVAALGELLGADEHGGRSVRGLFDALGGDVADDQPDAARVDARHALLADLQRTAAERAGVPPPILVASEECARGLDIPHVGLVMLLQLPPDVDRYVHLAGRTGRAGASGSVVSLVDWTEKRRLASFDGQLNTRIRPLAEDSSTWLPRSQAESEGEGGVGGNTVPERAPLGMEKDKAKGGDGEGSKPDWGQARAATRGVAGRERAPVRAPGQNHERAAGVERRARAPRPPRPPAGGRFAR